MLSAVKLRTPVPLASGGNPLYAAIPIRPIRPLVSYKESSVMPNWHHSDSYSRTDFSNAQKHCVDVFSRFSELLVDYTRVSVCIKHLNLLSKWICLSSA